jgi:hypothetical protein
MSIGSGFGSAADPSCGATQISAMAARQRITVFVCRVKMMGVKMIFTVGRGRLF